MGCLFCLPDIVDAVLLYILFLSTPPDSLAIYKAFFFPTVTFCSNSIFQLLNLFWVSKEKLKLIHHFCKCQYESARAVKIVWENVFKKNFQST